MGGSRELDSPVMLRVVIDTNVIVSGILSRKDATGDHHLLDSGI